ncbi:MAG TPA: substrate-binding domain-containing protein [Actinomycetota bacterium]|jgi:DNA-binding XRE family transcriptional regulator/molybdate-binding protein|nr:substrate-binding domain-containing protein [Actinomycetota bacterium]
MSRLRQLRSERGLSQAQLAAAAGLSRQLVGAVEGGRHTPSVTAALALARVLGSTVEALFPPSGDQVPILGAAPPEGCPVVAAMVAERLGFAALPDRGAGIFEWRLPDGIWRNGKVELLPAAEIAGFVVVGCDPALGMAASLLPDKGPQRLVAVHGSSAAGLDALNGGRTHAALAHGPSGKVPAPESPAQRMRLGRWEVGVAVAGSEADANVLRAIAEGRVSIAYREPGAGAQGALERALGDGPHRLRGTRATGHLDAARRAASGAVDAALTIRSAAHAYGLSFLQLEEHEVDLFVADRFADHPGAGALQSVLSSTPFRARMEAMTACRA